MVAKTLSNFLEIERVIVHFSPAIRRSILRRRPEAGQR